MRKTLPIAAAAIASVLVVGYVAQAGGSQGRQAVVLHVIEHATTDTVIDIGPVGDSSGDLLTFANEIFDESNAEKVGRNQGDCVRINVTEGSWECRWILFVAGGALTVEGPFFDTKDSILIITGGRGIYSGAGGSMQLKLRDSLTEFDFIYKIILN